MPDNKTILIHKIKTSTHIYCDLFLVQKTNEELLNIWLRISKPIKQPKQHKLILQEV